MPICTASAQPIGTLIEEGRHNPFRASACPLQALAYDESQMQDSDPARRQERGELIYDC